MEILNQLNFARMYSLGKIKQSNEDAWDLKPNGFNNTIRWNTGHIFATMESLTKRAIPSYEIVNPEWATLFVPGTNPDSWEMEPPTMEELIHALEEQPSRLKEALENNMQNQLTEPMAIGKLYKMDTVEAIVQFIVWHEGVHAGIIHALNRATQE